MIFQSSEQFFILMKLIGEHMRVLEELLYGRLSAAVIEGFEFWVMLYIHFFSPEREIWCKHFHEETDGTLKDSSFKEIVKLLPSFA